MESESNTPNEASRLLAVHDRTVERARVIPREYVFLLIWWAVVITAYITTYLMAASADEFTAPYSLLFPIIAFGALTNGANERFGVKPRFPRTVVVLLVTLLAVFMALLALAMFGPDYPWWINLALPLTLFVALLVAGRRLMSRSRPDESSTWATAPLSTPVRVSTSIVGIAIGALVATQPLDLASAISAVLGMIVLVALLAAWTTSFGLARAGFEWARIHWIGFGIATAIAQVVALLVAWTTVVTTPIAIALGTLAALTMIGSAFVTIRER